MTTPTKPNAELAYATLDQIDEHPELHDQSWWFTVTECGTTGCFAGWACLLSGDKPDALDRPMHLLDIGADVSFVVRPDGVTQSVSEHAQELLGLDWETARRLFASGNTRERLGDLVAKIFGPRPEVSASLIVDFADGDEGDAVAVAEDFVDEAGEPQ